ncbi:hypothetical protein BVRB_016040 isoform A [Beta vulgaris subsp. vulgaris]|uniref:Uncharacterized protein n=1 Tax=Beta vulgaris subsp. vulgaris TaxID=3555 RepID=A0A0J8B4C4_BETVV|nr:hypothetical protein BVRB_016040 isoform A [Beta vulgaris subsp. vulgaris]
MESCSPRSERTFSSNFQSFKRKQKCDLLNMPSISQLENDAKYSMLYQLLKIFLTQRLDAYVDFEAANSSLLKSYGSSNTTSRKCLAWSVVLMV